MTSRRMLLKSPLAMLPLAMPAVGRAQSAAQLVVWHDLGDNGTKWFTEVSSAFAENHPGVSIRAISYPTDQWFGRVIGAINTDTAPDLIFNNYERVIRIADQTGKVTDLRATLAGVAEKSFLSPDDLRVATYRDRMIILPIQRVQMGFGARKSWLDKAGEKFPATWDDAKRAAEKFQAADPATFGFALEAAHPRDLIHMLDLFIFGTGLRNTLLAPDGAITVDEPQHAQVLEQFLRIFTSYKLVPPDTINYSFNEMYQVIEGGRAGMFRVGDWNVAKWTAQAIKGDFVVGPWPAFFPDKQNAVVIGGMRGIAVPENAPHKELSLEVAAFLLGKQAQQASLKLVGSAVRSDLDTTGLPEESKKFVAHPWPLNAYDFPESIHPWYPELEAGYHRKLLGAIASPPSDYGAFIRQTAQEMRESAKALAQKG